MRFPPQHSLVECHWVDVVGQINSELSKCVPAKCVTVGRLIKIEKDYIVIASSIYEGEGEDPTIDGCALPLQLILKCRKVTSPKCIGKAQ